MLKERRRRIVRRSDTKDLSIAEIHVSERSLANAHRVREHGLEDQLQLHGRARDDLQHLRGRGLLLQRVGEFAFTRYELSLQLARACFQLFQLRVGLADTVKARSRLRSARTKLATARSFLRPLARQGHLVGTVTGPLPGGANQGSSPSML